MSEDEEGTLAALKTIRRELGDPKVKEHRGRIVKTTGDGLLVEFPSVVDAVRCAVEVQEAMAERNAGVPEGQRIDFRIGLNLGDVILDEGDIFGDGVNIAARLEALAAPGGICVSRIVRDQVRDRIDVTFEDMGVRLVKNIARPVHVFRIRIDGTTAPAKAPPPLPNKPSIAVLPFQNLSGDPEQEYFVDGMVEEITTALSRIRWLFVIARNSSFTYKGQAVDVKQVANELGVRYVLEGSVRKGGNRVRITAQLVEAETGSHLWADRFDGVLDDVFELQDKVASSVAGIIEPALLAAETARAAIRPTTDPTAYDAYLRAAPIIVSSTKEIPEALALLEKAIGRDPSYGPALAWAAICCMRMNGDGSSTDPQADRRKGMDYARRALQLASDDPMVLVNAAWALASFGEDLDAMIGLVDRALQLNPSYTHGWLASGALRIWAGDSEGAIGRLENVLRLNPRGSQHHAHSLIGSALMRCHRFDEAIRRFNLAIQGDPNYPSPYRRLAVCYAHLGRLDEARAMVTKLRELNAMVVPSFELSKRQEDRELILSGLRLAMGEDV